MWLYQYNIVYIEIVRKLISRLEYNHEIETLKFKFLVAQETIEKLRKELKLKEQILNFKQQNSGEILNSRLQPQRRPSNSFGCIA